MIKMIATDLDGTLLRYNKTISRYTASILRRCIDKGIKIVIATARPIRAVKMLEIPIIFEASIYHNGAVIDDGHENILHFGIPSQSIQDIVAIAFQNDAKARVFIEINDNIYGNSDASDLWPGTEVNLTDFSNLPLGPADKIILIESDMHKIETIRKTLPKNLYLETSENTVGMIMNKDATKKNAIKQLCKMFSMSQDEVVAFGDDYNDIKMLEFCGIGVAVANAIDEVKAVANFICGTNEHDGVAKWIEENIL